MILPLDDAEDIAADTPVDETEDDKESPERTEEDVIEDDDRSDLLLDDPGPAVFNPPTPVRCCLGIIVAEAE